MNFKPAIAVATLSMAALSASVYGQQPAPHGPRIHFNRHPTQIYEVTLTVHDAPGPLRPADGGISYGPGTDCVPRAVLNEGGYGFSQGVPFNINWLNPKTANVYRTYVATDLIVDEDYYGQGLCHWAINSLGLQIFRDGNIETNIGYWSATDWDGKDWLKLASGQPLTTYFPKDSYIHPDNYPGEGKSVSQADYLKTPEAERSKFFYTTLNVQKIKPRPSLQRWVWLNYASRSTEYLPAFSHK